MGRAMAALTCPKCPPTPPVAAYDAHRGRPTKRKHGFLSDLFDD